MINIIKANNSNIHIALKIRLEMLREVNNLSDNSAFSNDFIESILSYFSRQDQTTLLALNDEKEVIGCATICYINILPTFSHQSGKRAHLMNVYTNKDYRRQGIAQKIIGQLIDEAKQKGVTEISLDATESGMPLYESCGFVKNKDGMLLLINQ